MEDSDIYGRIYWIHFPGLYQGVHQGVLLRVPERDLIKVENNNLTLPNGKVALLNIDGTTTILSISAWKIQELPARSNIGNKQYMITTFDDGNQKYMVYNNIWTIIDPVNLLQYQNIKYLQPYLYNTNNNPNNIKFSKIDDSSDSSDSSDDYISKNNNKNNVEDNITLKKLLSDLEKENNSNKLKLDKHNSYLEKNKLGQDSIIKYLKASIACYQKIINDIKKEIR